MSAAAYRQAESKALRIQRDILALARKINQQVELVQFTGGEPPSAVFDEHLALELRAAFEELDAAQREKMAAVRESTREQYPNGLAPRGTGL